MERVDAYRVDEGLPPEKVEAVNCRHAPVVRRSQGGEAPQLLAGYLGRIGRSRLLARGGVGPQSPSEIRQRAGAPDREKPEAHGLGRQEVPRHGTAFEELIQEGNIGLMKAADRFDPEMGHRFSTYATWWIT